MLKKLLSALFMALPFICAAQSDTSRIPIPMKKGIIYYEQNFILNTNVPKQVQFRNAVNWFNGSFSNTGGYIKTADQNTRQIDGIGNFKVKTGQTGNYYWLRFMVTITLSDSTYTFKAYNVYEKPIEKGISNEFSKLEYRWWDFRQGHPWSAKDEPLFRGLNTKMNMEMNSLQKKHWQTIK